MFLSRPHLHALVTVHSLYREQEAQAASAAQAEGAQGAGAAATSKENAPTVSSKHEKTLVAASDEEGLTQVAN